MEEYKKSITEYADVQDAILYYEQKGREEGREEGFSEGFSEGIEKGREEGVEIGVEKGIEQEKIEIAKNCLTKGLSIEMIAEITGLSQAQIESLKNHP